MQWFSHKLPFVDVLFFCLFRFRFRDFIWSFILYFLWIFVSWQCHLLFFRFTCYADHCYSSLTYISEVILWGWLYLFTVRSSLNFLNYEWHFHRPVILNRHCILPHNWRTTSGTFCNYSYVILNLWLSLGFWSSGSIILEGWKDLIMFSPVQFSILFFPFLNFFYYQWFIISIFLRNNIRETLADSFQLSWILGFFSLVWYLFLFFLFFDGFCLS